MVFRPKIPRTIPRILGVGVTAAALIKNPTSPQKWAARFRRAERGGDTGIGGGGGGRGAERVGWKNVTVKPANEMEKDGMEKRVKGLGMNVGDRSPVLVRRGRPHSFV